MNNMEKEATRLVMQGAIKGFPTVDHNIDWNVITEEIEEGGKTAWAR